MNMKKMTAAVLSVLMLTGMTACGGKEAGSSVAPAQSTAAADGKKTPAESLSFSYVTDKGVEIPISAPSDPIVEQLGTPVKSFEAPSCAFSGTSYTYNYTGFTLETYPDNNVNKVYAVTVTGSQPIKEGLKIGDSAESVKEVCGVPSRSSDAFIMYQSGDTALQFFLSGDKVSSIVYTLMV